MSALVHNKPNEVAVPKMRLACSVFTWEVGGDGSYEDALSLLEHLGWRVHGSLICPRCMKAKAQKFKRDYFDE